MLGLTPDKDNVALLDTYDPEEILNKYIVRVAGKGFTVVDHPSEVYGFPDAHECIDGNLPLRLVLDIDARQKPDPMNPKFPFLDESKISREDLLSKILIACVDIINTDLKHFAILDAFTLASSSNANKCSWHIVYKYARFIDYRDLKGFVEKVADKQRKIELKRPAISSVKKGYHKLEDYLVQPKWNASEIWPRTFSPEKEEKKFQPIEDETALSNGASLSLSNESKTKLDELKASGFRICNYQNIQGDLSINEWDIIIVQVESLFRIEFTARPFVAILDEANAIMRQMSSGTNARESENAIRDVLRICETFDNKYQPRIGETVEFIYDPNSGAEAMRIGYDLLRQGKRVSIPRAYYGNMDGKQRQKDFSNIDVAWGELDCVAYTNTVEAGISFEVTGHFDIVIAITNITTPVHVEALAQMLYRIRDCRENIRAELESARPNNLPTSIKGHREWDSKRRFLIKSMNLLLLIASTGASLQLIKMDESRGVIGNRKKVRNEVRVEALVIKETDFDAVATSRNLDPEEAENLKFDQERSIPDTMALKRFYMRIFMQGYDEESAMKGLEVKDIAQWEDSHYKAGYNSEKSVAEDLHKSYSANHWKVIRELFQILGFTGIDDKRILSTIRAINAIAGNWCGYTVKINRKKIGPKEKQVWERSYQINRQPYDGLGFGDKGTPELPPYRPKTDNDIQELFDSIGQDK
ncbi:hypothetical protein GLOIN_2v1842826 [Rhizophagus irregularis DAOM 181602=DAOM 197198]|nr:hypothetical protein GLOIN_2v1842826 [Rhizophagus irregularis DAOM 181602=DAOM 197198]